ncbi:MAG: anthranilate phosphoribosyltransferase, partial [Victivallales bacterium]|nr:anthranilate phosphoribosyltransferase [Victivallales bacterium]
MFTQVLEQLIKGEDLSPTEITAAMNDIMSGNATDAQIGAFLMGLRIKGETPAEVAAAAGVMRKHATLVDAGA